jgi:hypothetical protein
LSWQQRFTRHPTLPRGRPIFQEEFMTLRASVKGSVQLLKFLSLLALLSGCAQNPPPPLPPAPPPGNQEKVLFSDNFQDYNPRWRQVRGQWAVVGGRLVQTRDDARELNTVMFYDPLTVADAEITTETTMLADLPQFLTAEDQELLRVKRQVAGAGIVFRYQDENNFYLFRLAGEDGVVLGKVVKGEWNELANPRAVDFAGVLLKMDTPYALRVRVQGNRIQCWVADKAVANLEDTSFSTGRIGLSTFRSKAAFTTIRVVER